MADLAAGSEDILVSSEELRLDTEILLLWFLLSERDLVLPASESLCIFVVTSAESLCSSVMTSARFLCGVSGVGVLGLDRADWSTRVESSVSSVGSVRHTFS